VTTRDVFLYLAKQERARDVIMWFPFSRQAALRFVAGEDLDAALKVVAELNGQGMLASLDYLGENVATADDALKAVADYTAMLERIASASVQSTVSLKLTQMGLNTGVPFCTSCVDKVIDLAAQHGKFVQIDMESSDYTDRTLAIFRDLRARHDNVGIVIQSYLYRSARDIEDLIPLGAHIRLCKGAYKEPVSLAFARKADVDRSYVALTERLLSAEARSKGAYLDIATHDPRIIAHVKDFAQRNGIGRD
jgi:proline dehydrogenase